MMYELMVGEIAGQMGQLDSAVVHYLKAAKRSADPRVAERATRIAAYAEDNARALQAAERWVALEPDNLEAHQFAAVLNVRNARLNEAQPHFEALIRASADSRDGGFLMISSILNREADVERATQAMGLILAQHQDNAYAHFVFANLAMRAGQFENAIAAADKAVQLDPDLTDARVMRARALQAKGDTDGALSEMRSLLKELPANHDLRLSYARMLVQAHQYEPALNEFERVSKARPDDTDLLYTMGLLSVEVGHYDRAERYLKRVLKSRHNVNESTYYLGRIDERRERFKSAMRWYLKVGEGEFFWDAQARVASMMGRQGKLKEARTHLSRLREQATDENTVIRLYLAEGQLLREQKAFKEGMEHYSRALLEFPGNSDLLYARALMAEQVGRLDLLEADLRAILARDPENATAMNALGYTLADRTQRYDEALALITKAHELRPDDPAVIDSMGWVQYRLGHLPEAEDYLRKAYSLLDDAEVGAHLGEVLWAQGKQDQARELLQRALKKSPSNEALLELKRRIEQ